jgi:tetraacyldisaccharide 4'-kinase
MAAPKLAGGRRQLDMSILPDPESFRRLADGSLRGPGPLAARTALAALALPYGLAVAARNACYDRGFFAARPAAVPVISVGNLTLGGTGKTPLVAWVCRRLIDLGRRPAVVSRGYAARPGERSDEAAELAILLPGVPHVADRDRVAGAAAAAAAGADVVVLDDGFQHRRLRRNLDIVAIDATDPFGCDRLFPRGLLREPLRGLTRAAAVVLTRAGGLPPADRENIRRRVAAARPGLPPVVWLETEHRPAGLRFAGGRTEPLDAVRGRPVAAFCGIGNPAAFRRTLAEAGAVIAGFRSFADHHAYSAADLASLAAWAEEAAADIVVTTLKDLVRIEAATLGRLPLAAVEIALEPLGPADALAELIAGAVGRGGQPG